jgi:hypothetical protein
MAPVSYTSMQQNSTTLMAVNAPVGLTEPSCFSKQKQNCTIPRASQSHQIPAAMQKTPPLGESHSVQDTAMLTEKLPLRADPEPFTRIHDPAPVDTVKAKKALSLKAPVAREAATRASRRKKAPAFLDVWPAPPSYTDLQRNRRQMGQPNPEWEWLDKPWQMCPWQDRGCPFSHKLGGQLNRHLKSCRYNPHPKLYQCSACKNQWTRRQKLVEHYEMDHCPR